MQLNRGVVRAAEMLANIVAGLAVGVGALVVLVEGIDVFTFWNGLPVLAVCLASRVAARRVSQSRWYALLPVGGAPILLVVGAGHVAWYFDWGQAATGSSTAALIFVFLPLWGTALGIVSAGIGAFILLVTRDAPLV